MILKKAKCMLLQEDLDMLAGLGTYISCCFEKRNKTARRELLSGRWGPSQSHMHVHFQYLSSCLCVSCDLCVCLLFCFVLPFPQLNVFSFHISMRVLTW